MLYFEAGFPHFAHFTQKPLNQKKSEKNLRDGHEPLVCLLKLKAFNRLVLSWKTFLRIKTPNSFQMPKRKQTRKSTMSSDKRLERQFGHLKDLPPSSSPERKRRWAEFRKELQKRLETLKGQLRELEKAKTWKRAQAARDEHIVRKAAKAGKEINVQKTMYTREELLQNLALRIKITRLKIFRALSQGTLEGSKQAGKLNSELLLLTETRDTILQRKKYYPGTGKRTEKTNQKGKG